MALTRATVQRGLVLLERDTSGVAQTVLVEATLALARCQRCKTRRRVLPCDALPRKTYGLAVIEQEISDYSRGDRSLRQVAWSQLGERTPAHTTLHGWTEGLGAHVLGRPSGELGGAPMSRLIAEASPRVPEIADAGRSEPTPDPGRYRTEARRDRLAAVMLAMTLVTLIAGAPHPHAMAECRRISLCWSNVSVLEFPSRLRCTSIGHLDRLDPSRSCLSSTGSRDRCPIRTRSPPDASSRSHS
jgi:hypothetical protein